MARHLEETKSSRVVEIGAEILSLNQTPHRVEHRHVICGTVGDRCQAAKDAIADDHYGWQKQR